MEKKIEFKVGNTTLRGKLFIPKGKSPFPAVIFFHGSGGVGEMYFEAAEKLSEKGILGFAFNYRGAGLSDGIFEEQTLKMGIDDAGSALSFLISCKEVDKKRIGICGASFGGFIAALLSVNSNATSLILIGPAAYSLNELNKQRDKAGDLNEDFVKSESFNQMMKFKGKFLMATSELDEVIPAKMINEYLKRAKSVSRKESFMLKGAKHRISINPKARNVLVKKIVDWFAKTL